MSGAESIEENIAYARRIAEESREAPLVGGPFYLIWGLGAVIALGVHYATLKGWTGLQHSQIGYIWLAFGVVGGVLTAVAGMFISKNPASRSVANKANSVVWVASAIAIFSFAIALLLKVFLVEQPEVISLDVAKRFDLIIAVAFLAYAISYSVTAALAKQKHLYVFALAAYAFAISAILLSGNPETYLLAMAGVFVLALVPGLAQVFQQSRS